MKTTYLVAISALMLAVAVVGLVMATVVIESLPTTMPERFDSFGDAHRDDVNDHRQFESSEISRVLAGADASARVDRAALAYDAHRDHDELAAELADATRAAEAQTRQHAAIGIGLLAALALAGALGLLRLRVRGTVALGGGLLALATLAGASVLVHRGGGMVAAIVVPACALAMIAQAIAANLVPEHPHALIASVERELRALAPHARRRYLAVRVGGGLVLAIGGGLGAMFAAIAPAPAFAALLATGAACITVPMIAVIRLRIADGELPAARIII